MDNTAVKIENVNTDMKTNNKNKMKKLIIHCIMHNMKLGFIIEIMCLEMQLIVQINIWIID